jgi:hypothetical protein
LHPGEHHGFLEGCGGSSDIGCDPGGTQRRGDHGGVGSGHAQRIPGERRRDPGVLQRGERACPPGGSHDYGRCVADDVAFRPGADDTAEMHENETVRLACLVHGVGAHQDGRAIGGGGPDSFPEAGPGERRHAGCGLVEHQQVRGVLQGSREGDPPLHAEREVADESIGSSLGWGRWLDSVHAGRELQILGNRQVAIQPQILRNVAGAQAGAPRRR